MNDFPSTMTSAAVWGCTKVEAKHQGSSHLYLCKFPLEAPKALVSQLSCEVHASRKSLFSNSAPYNSLAQGYIATT